MYYPSSENKGADQLRGYREADLRRCFRISRTLVFSRRGSNAKFNGCKNDNFHLWFHLDDKPPIINKHLKQLRTISAVHYDYKTLLFRLLLLITSQISIYIKRFRFDRSAIKLGYFPFKSSKKVK